MDCETSQRCAHRCGHCAREYRVSNNNMAALKVKRKRRRADNLSAKRSRLSDIEARDHASQDHASQDYVSQDNVSQDHISQNHASQEHASQDNASQDHASQDHPSQDHASQNYTTQDHASLDHVSQDHASSLNGDNDIISICGSESTIQVSLIIE